MLGSKLVLASMIAVFLLCCQVQAATTSNWDVCRGGSWADANNWDSTTVPDNYESDTFDVVFDPNVMGYCFAGVDLQENRTINRLFSYGEVGLESWGGRNELTVESGLINYGYLEIEKIQINGNVTNIDGAELCLCDMDIEGILYNEPGAMIEVEDGVCIESELTSASSFLVNYGTLEIIPYSELWVKDVLDNTGEMNVYSGICGCDNIFNNPGVISGFGVIGSGGVFTNYGEITAYGGSLALWCHYLTNDGTLSNTPLSSLQIDSKYDVWNEGTIYARTGGGVAFGCSLVNDANGLIELLGGTLAAAAITQTAGAEFTGFGSIAGNIVIQANARIELDGPTNIIGDVTIDSDAVLVISVGQTMITGRTKNDGTILLAGGTVLFTGGYSGSGEIIDAAVLIGHWQMDDDAASATVVDIAGHNNGTLFDVGGTATTEAHHAEGKIGGCLTFDGIDDYIDIGCNPIPSSGDWTLAGWIYCEGARGGTDNRGNAFGSGSWSGTAVQGIIIRLSPAGHLKVELGDGVSYIEQICVATMTTTDVNKWYHIAVVYDSTNTQARVYVNGAYSFTINRVYAQSNVNFTVGNSLGLNASASYWYGGIDNVMIFNKALSAGQIEALYNEYIRLH